MIEQYEDPLERVRKERKKVNDVLKKLHKNSNPKSNKASVPKAKTIEKEMKKMKKQQLKGIRTDIKEKIKQLVSDSFDVEMPKLTEKLTECETQLKQIDGEDKKIKLTKQKNSEKRAVSFNKSVQELTKKYTNLLNEVNQFKKNTVERLEPILCLTAGPNSDDQLEELVQEDPNKDEQTQVQEVVEVAPAPVVKKQYKKKKSAIPTDPSLIAKELPQISYVGATKPYECNSETFARSQFSVNFLKLNPYSGEKRNRKKASEAENLFESRVSKQQQQQQSQKKKKTTQNL